ncbi:MAG: radical SAM protein [Crenarchaeota archaeon]|nr:radical SAM protein [Thermoproteota archaeon]MCR8473000.1 radical SAM protein [Thermoproteota archaeon]
MLRLSPKAYKKSCAICKNEKLLSSVLSVCRDCIINRFEDAKDYIINAHRKVRARYLLPYPAPSDGNIICSLCSNNCKMKNGDISFCGLRWVEENKLRSYVSPNQALAYVYLDPHITNCCAAWFCPAGTGLGYPEYSVTKGPEYGYSNLAVFFYGCNFNCLFCQNWEHKDVSGAPVVQTEDLVQAVIKNDKITCICYFGGSPEPHAPFFLKVNEELLERKGKRIVRICYEWNGAGNSTIVRKAAESALLTGGVIKFDLKAPPGSPLSMALSGVDNKRVYENFEMVYREFWSEAKIPILTATTLLVPGYIMPEDVEEIAQFIASLNPEIPYSILVFHPDGAMTDLPITPRQIAEESERRARKYLKHVNVGNKFLLTMAPERI